jgi:hypothetical protein
MSTGRWLVIGAVICVYTFNSRSLFLLQLITHYSSRITLFYERSLELSIVVNVQYVVQRH